VQLLSLKASNVFSLGDVSLDLANRGVLLVTGYSEDDQSGNGAGKSSLANHAIVWGLYGQTYDGSRGDSVINTNSNNLSGNVEILFVASNGDIHKIVRTRGPNSLKLFNGSSDIGHRLEKETQLQINHLLGMDFTTFIHSSLIGPGTERSFFKLSGAEQVSIVEALLPVHSLDEWAARAKELADAAATGVKELESKALFTLGRLNFAEESLATIKLNQTYWEDQKLKSLDAARSELSRLLIRKAEEDISIAQIVNFIGEDWAEVKESKSIEYNKLNCDLSVIHTEMSYLESIISNYICKSCKQNITDTHKEQANKTLDSTLLELMEIKSKQEKISAWMAMARVLSEITPVQPLIDDKNKDIFNLENMSYHSKISIETLEQEIAGLRKIYEFFKCNISTFLAQETWLRFWINGFSKDLKTAMIEEVCPFLENRINMYLEQLNNSQFKATVSTVKSLKSGDIRERFNLEVRSVNGANSFDLLSVGEKQIVSFAAALAIADLASNNVTGKSNVLILDEPFMGLHETNCNNVINFLNSSHIESTLLISNDEEIKTLIANRVHIVKSKGQSWLA
jgi:DNA repair exonuclease SbcCD ATPase subunit